MSNEAFEQWLAFSKDASEPFVKLNELSDKAMEQVARQQLDMARDYLDLGSRQMELLSSAKDPQEWLKNQSELSTDFSRKLVDRAEEFMRIAGDTQKEVAAWTEQTAEKMRPKTA